MPNEFLARRDQEIRLAVILVVILALMFILSSIFGVRVQRDDHSVPTQVAVGTFPEVELEAKSAYVFDVRTETVLYALEENKRMPLASLTKIMSALVAEDLSPSYGTVTVTSEALKSEGDSGLRVGEKWRLRDLLDFSLVSSSNDGIRAVALALGALDSAIATDEEIISDFVRRMNAKALELDLKNTYFWNETGLDESEVKGGAYGTAKDIATLMTHIVRYHPETLSATRESLATLTSLNNLEHKTKNTNLITGSIPGLLASKTGFTDTAGGNLAFVFDPEIGRPIVVVLMGSTVDGRFADAEKLVSASVQYINGIE